LGKNTTNRKIRQGSVNYYANEMINGRWKETGQGISFFEDGSLADGQHRLLGIIKSGVTISLPVARGIKKDAMGSYDVGAKRSVGDYLNLHMGEKNANRKAAAICNIVRTFFGTNLRVSADLTVTILDIYRDQMEQVVSFTHTNHLLRKGWIIAAFTVALKSHPDVSDFIAAVASGANLKPNSPELAFSRWIAQSENTRASLNDRYLRIAYTALYAFIKGSNVSLLRPSNIGINYFRKREQETISLLEGELIMLRDRKETLFSE